jgi:hypothetical protein
MARTEKSGKSRESRKKRAVSLAMAVFLTVTGASPVFADAPENSVTTNVTTAATTAVTRLKLDFPDRKFKTEVRWWLAQGGHTDQTLLESVKELYDAGFSGIECAMLNDEKVPADIYGYGSAEWFRDAKTLLRETTRLGMGLSFTGGTHWASANVPGLDPASEEAQQEFAASEEPVKAGRERGGFLTLPVKREGVDGLKQIPIIVCAYRLEGEYDANATCVHPMRLVPDSFIDLTDQIAASPEEGNEGRYKLTWTAPEDGDYVLFNFCRQGSARRNDPAVKPSYDINCFDERGTEALKKFLKEYYFSDDEFVELVRENGDAQLFMDSLEIGVAGGGSFWTEDMPDIFMERKGYDIRRYLPLFIQSGEVFTEEIKFYRGKYDLSGADGGELRRKIRNDLYDIHTQLLMENMLEPLREWLNAEYAMKLRAQISYGQYLEISCPALAVDCIESESRNMRDQPDAFRVHAGAAHLLGKLYSSELGADDRMNYMYSLQDYLQKVYAQFSGGVNRIVWHGYASRLGPTEDSAPWPGYEAGMGTIAGRWGAREPAYKDYDEYNDHIARLQTVLSAGKPRIDLGILYLDYGYWCPRRAYRENEVLLGLQNHFGLIWKDLALQERGYTYDYFAPQYLEKGLVKYDPASGLISPDGPGYRAMMVFQEWMPLPAAEALLDLARQGMKLVVVGPAMTKTAFYAEHIRNNGERLAAVRAELLALPNVTAAESQADALGALQDMGVVPRAGFGALNRQLQIVTREDEDALYMFLWNYENNGGEKDHCETDILLDGLYVPYVLDAWSGGISSVPVYSVDDGKTRVPVSVPYHDASVYIFKPADSEAPHLVAGEGAEILVKDGKYYVRATEKGEYTLTGNDGALYNAAVGEVPPARDLTGWSVKIESWDKPDTGDASNWIGRTETHGERTTTEGRWLTRKTEINLVQDELKTWDNIDQVGREVSGIGYYATRFHWDADAADGAWLDLGPLVQTAVVTVNGEKTKDVNINRAIVNITPLLKDGLNELKITVTASLTNRQLANGYLTEGVDTDRRYDPITDRYQVFTYGDHARRYFSNGLPKALLIPYKEAEAQPVLQE